MPHHFWLSSRHLQNPPVPFLTSHVAVQRPQLLIGVDDNSQAPDHVVYLQLTIAVGGLCSRARVPEVLALGRAQGLRGCRRRRDGQLDEAVVLGGSCHILPIFCAGHCMASRLRTAELGILHETFGVLLNRDGLLRVASPQILAVTHAEMPGGGDAVKTYKVTSMRRSFLIRRQLLSMRRHITHTPGNRGRRDSCVLGGDWQHVTSLTCSSHFTYTDTEAASNTRNVSPTGGCTLSRGNRVVESKDRRRGSGVTKVYRLPPDYIEYYYDIGQWVLA
ncbi:hypothetical protein VTK56DRAFT_1019 [Thermocarpiscus australiensis]